MPYHLTVVLFSVNHERQYGSESLECQTPILTTDWGCFTVDLSSTGLPPASRGLSIFYGLFEIFVTITFCFIIPVKPFRGRE